MEDSVYGMSVASQMFDVAGQMFDVACLALLQVTSCSVAGQMFDGGWIGSQMWPHATDSKCKLQQMADACDGTCLMKHAAHVSDNTHKKHMSHVFDNM